MFLNITKKHFFGMIAYFLFLSSTIIVIHKVGSLKQLRFASSLKLFYAIFFISLILFILLWINKKITLGNFFILSLPTELILIFGTQTSPYFHYIFHLFIGLWVILLGYLILYKKYKKEFSHSKIPKLPKLRRYDLLILLFISLVVFMHLFFGSYRLNKAAYTDEKLWTYGSGHRIEKYWNNIAETDWRNAIPSDKPGVTLAIISGPGLIWETPSSFFNNYSNKEALLQMFYVMRLPIVIFGSVMVFVFYFLLKNLIGTRPAVLGTIFICLSPILIGMGRIINPDALSFIFIPFALFSYLIHRKNKNVYWLYITGIFLGLGLLTKYIANLLIIFFFVSAFLEIILGKEKDQDVPRLMKDKLSEFASIIFIALSVFYLLFPGVWLKLDRLLLGTLWSEPFLPIWKYFLLITGFVIFDTMILKCKTLSWLIKTIKKIKPFITLSVPLIFILSLAFMLWNTYTQMSVFDFVLVFSSPKSFAKNNDLGSLGIFFSGFYAMFFSIAPIAILGVLAGIVATIKDAIKNRMRPSTLVIWNLLLFILIYYAGSAFSSVGPTIRYQIILYPLFYAIAGIGIYQIIKSLSKKSGLRTMTDLKSVFWVVAFSIVIYQIFNLSAIKPYFSSYNSPLLPKKYLVNPKNMGDGNYETAKFLNSLPNAENLKIWSDNNGVCALFVGKCINTFRGTSFYKNGPEYDYYVISQGRKARITRLAKEKKLKAFGYFFHLDKLYESPDFIFEINPGNRSANYIRAFKKGSVIINEKK